MTTERTVNRRRLAITCAIAAPTILAMLLVGAVETWRLRRPATATAGTPFAYSLAEAIARDDVLRAYEFIREGQDPNHPVLVHDAVLTGGRQRLVAPIVWAVAHNSRQAVQMLIGHGARLDATVLAQAMCVATQLGHEDVARVLRARGALQPVECAVTPGDAPLLGN